MFPNGNEEFPIVKDTTPQIHAYTTSKTSNFGGTPYQKLIPCEFNIDTAYVELKYSDGSMISINCTAVEEHIVHYGVTEFIVGRYGCFDGLAAKAVKTAKQTHPEVGLTLLLPYHPAELPIPVPDGFDSTYYPPEMENVPRKLLLSGQIGIWSIILIS